MKPMFTFSLAMICSLLFFSCSEKNNADIVPIDEHPPSRYYVRNIDPFIVRPGFTMINLPAFQQTTEYTCGPAAVVTLLSYYGQTVDEMQLAEEMQTSSTTGTTPENMAEWLENNGFAVEWGENGSLEMIRENLAKDIPTLIEWSDWGGHWVLAIGYDTRNTDDLMDDVIIFADPYDRHDDLKDGIDWFNAQRFYYMWYDALLFGRVMRGVYIKAQPLAKL